MPNAYVRRARIEAALTRAARLPVTLLVAPAGGGKTIAIEQFLETVAGTVHRYDVLESQASLMRFVRGFAAALKPALPNVSQSLAIAHERAMQSANAADVLAAWIAEHLGDESRTVVIDDYHHCEADPSVATFLARAVERTRGNVRWVIASRTISELPLAIWLARGDAELPIDEALLRLTQHEAHELARETAPTLHAGAIERLLDATSGSPGKIAFALRSFAREPDIAQRVLDAGGDPYERLTDELLLPLVAAERRLIFESAFFPDLDEDLVEAAGVADAARLLSGLRAKIPQLFTARAGPPRYDALFRNVLVARISARGAGAVRAAVVRTARALERTERIVEALAYYARGRDFDALAALLERRGLGLVEAGYGETVLETIASLDPIAQTGSGVILAIKAMFESRLGRFDTAESWFQLALDRAADGSIRRRIGYQYGTHLLRFFRPEAIDLLERLVADAAPGEDVRAYALAALGPAYVFAGRVTDASHAVERALEAVARTSNTHLRARAHHQAAYVALYGGDGERSKQLAGTSLAIAREHGYFDVAAGALTVLYNVAADLEDDPVASLRLLEEVADCAAKSGCLNSHLLALIAKLEIEVERGDERAIAQLDEKLRTLDVTCCNRASYEALLPSQALRAGWTGDYAGAYRLLAASAFQQWSADRKALRWAEIAVYAAAAGLSSEAAAAIASARDLLDDLDPVDVRVARTRLFLALATIVLGRAGEATDLFAAIDEHRHALSARLASLGRAVDALRERYRGARNQDAVLAACDDLARLHFGGIARMIMNLPLADNASLRLRELTARERRVLAQAARDRSFASDTRVAGIVAKLGCADRGAALRAVIRHPFITHASPNGAFSEAEKALVR